MTTVMPAMPKPMERSQDFPRYGKPGPGGEAPKRTGKKLADQTLTVAGKEIKCEVWETVIEAAGKKITSKSFISKEVPGWMVKTESDVMGTMKTVTELVEFKK
jgi:hypothetical protein